MKVENHETILYSGIEQNSLFEQEKISDTLAGAKVSTTEAFLCKRPLLKEVENDVPPIKSFQNAMKQKIQKSKLDCR